MKKIFSIMLASAGLAAQAVELTGLADDAFAEKYAFSTNRAALIATLKPESAAWFAYSILDAQTEGRLDESRDLLEKWERFSGRDNHPYKVVRALQDRQAFLAFGSSESGGPGASKPLSDTTARSIEIMKLKRALDEAGIRVNLPPRETEVPPDTYPSAVPAGELSFDAFWRRSHNDKHAFEDGFRQIAIRPGTKILMPEMLWTEAAEKHLPGEPGLMETIVAYLNDKDRHHVFRDTGAMATLTLDQLMELAKATKGRAKDVSANAAFANAVLSRIAAGEMEDAGDPAVRLAVLERRLAFAETLAPSLRKTKLEALRELVDFHRNRGDFSRTGLFLKYLRLAGESESDRTGKTLVWMEAQDAAAEWIAAAHLAGKDLKPFEEFYGKGVLARIKAEAELLAGKAPSETDTAAIPPGRYRELQKKTELVWARSNPRAFAGDEDVSLAIDVKNVPSMTVSVYELDASAARRIAGGETRADMDLDCAVPGTRREMDFSRFPAMHRHRETIALPELKRPGEYVVECSGAGLCSRAVVRKGRLFASVRRDAAGWAFRAFGEDGKTAAGSRAWIGGNVFEQDETGEIPVPFDALRAAEGPGAAKAVIEAGRLATAIAVPAASEDYLLEMAVAMPHDALAAGETAACIVRPSLFAGGTRASIAILENPSMTIRMVDSAGRKSVETIAPFKLDDSAESVCRFTVPSRLAEVELILEGTVKRLSDGTEQRLSAVFRRGVNGISKGVATGQAFLRNTRKGWIVELRGRNGEPLPSVAARFEFKHRAFKGRERHWSAMLQADADGTVSLGSLEDIEEVATDAFGGFSWRTLPEGPVAMAPASIAAAEGEKIEIAAGGLLSGGWPGAGELKSRACLVETRGGRNVADFTPHCSFAGGSLRIENLPAGRYKLFFAAEGATVDICVAPAKRAPLLAQNREPPRRLAIASASCDGAGKLTVKLANASADARVHVVASRTAADANDGASAFAALARAPGGAGGGAMPDWKPAEVSYISGRDLGDRLRYIHDRRREGPRTGIMLDKPSLLLNPRSVAETETSEHSSRRESDWAIQGGASAGADRSMRNLASAPAAQIAGAMRGGYACRDFAPAPAAVFANLRPDENGTVSLDLSGLAGLGLQDVEIAAVDGDASDARRIVAGEAAFTPRDLRVKPGDTADAAFGRTKKYVSAAQLYALAKSADPGDAALAKFSFVASWARADDAAKRDAYGKCASHELDLFVYFKDRPFFDAVAAPLLRDKRRKDFIDKWLLGEDLSEYAAPGRLQDLNALEACLLAMRNESVRKAVADMMARRCNEEPADVETLDSLLAIATGEMQETGPTGPSSYRLAEMEPAPAMECATDYAWAPPAQADYGNQSTAAAGEIRAAMKGARMRGGASAAAASSRIELERRRKAKKIYRPPERTKEWVETYWYGGGAAEAGEIAPNRFWLDCAADIARGGDGRILAPSVIEALGSTFPSKMAAIAISGLPLEEAAGGGGAPCIVFSRNANAYANGKTSKLAKLDVVQHFFTLEERGRDGAAREPKEFVAGTVYELETIVINPTAEERRVCVAAQIPAGAIPLGGCGKTETKTVEIQPYNAEQAALQLFYFPSAGEGFGKTDGAVAAGQGVGKGAPPALKVVAAPTEDESGAWRHVSQKASAEEALEWLATKPLDGIDLDRIGWRMKDPAFAKKLLAVLEKRGAYSENLWLAGTIGKEWHASFDPARFRQAVARKSALRKLAPALGPALASPLADIEPEESGIFEHREYWPMINARAHVRPGAGFTANKSFAAEWRAFLDVLAAKKAPSPRDRLLAAVFLAGQDRMREAERQFAEAKAGGGADGETAMQRDYMEMFFAFARGDLDAARPLAAKHAKCASPVWRGRFAAALAQLDEAAGLAPGAPAGDASAEAPSIALSPVSIGGATEAVAISARNLKSCMVKAYPVDVEIAFSKNPFGDAAGAAGGILGMKSAWTEEVAIGADGTATAVLPRNLRRTDLIVTATGAGGRVVERIEAFPGSLDVQVVREWRQLRVRRPDGRPAPSAYVKVYARDAGGSEVRFLKDGYTDLRGAFDYASVSTDSDFKPAAYAIFVVHPDFGAKTMRVERR